MPNTRIIFIHKQGTSARLRFLKFAYGGIYGFTPIPLLAQVMDETAINLPLLHPAPYISQAEEYFSMNHGELACMGEFCAFVDVPRGPIQIFLAYFTHVDPPFAAVQRLGAEFIELPQALDLSDVELELMRQVYTLVIGG